MAKAKNIPVFDTPSESSYASLAKRLLDDYFSASTFSSWLFGSASLVLILLIASNYWKENVYFPFFVQSKGGSLETTIVSSQSAVLIFYDFFGKNKISFNDIFKSIVLLLIAVMFLKTIFNTLIRPFMGKIKNLLEIIAPYIYKFFEKIITKLPRNFRLKEWVANPLPLNVYNAEGQPVYPQLRRKVPFKIRRFHHLKFNFKIVSSTGHWRVGVFITNAKDAGDYVFHLYQNKNDNRVLSKMTKRVFAVGHKDESDKEVSLLVDSNILFELKRIEKNIYSLIVNGTEIDTYKVPASEFEYIDFGAWADDLPYNVEFKNIEFLG